jgi:hypothetical protein
VYLLFFQQVVIGPLGERNANSQLEEAKQMYPLSSFESDGCSGNVSRGWQTAVGEISKIFPNFADRYDGIQRIPFESACVLHDEAYHQGVGGYTARLTADNALRTAILSYGIENTQEIQARMQLATPEEATFMYEIIAETVYRGVRVGGAACTGMPYAWGFGYNNGTCN